MKTCIALLRGINVGGKGTLPMKSLVSILEALGMTAVKTYIQSGNAVFRTRARSAGPLGAQITAAIQEAHGFSPHTLVLDLEAYEAALAANPYLDVAEADPKSVHFWFMDVNPAKPDLDSLEKLRTERESFTLKGQVFYLRAPDGIGRSKLAVKVEKALGVPATARNWRTVSTLRDMAQAAESL